MPRGAAVKIRGDTRDIARGAASAALLISSGPPSTPGGERTHTGRWQGLSRGLQQLRRAPRPRLPDLSPCTSALHRSCPCHHIGRKPLAAI